MVAALVASDQERDSWHRLYRPVNAMTSALDGRVPRDRTVLVANGAEDSGTGFAIQTALMYDLRRTRHRVVTSDPLLARKLGSRYSIRHHPPDAVLTIDDRPTPAPVAGRIVARTAVAAAPGIEPAVRVVTLTLGPAPVPGASD